VRRRPVGHWLLGFAASADLRYVTDIEHLFIRDNAALVDVDISALENVDDLHVVNNPGLAPSIFDGVESRAT
jgi:hypothetical protein